jgi:ribosomal protein L40E
MQEDKANDKKGCDEPLPLAWIGRPELHDSFKALKAAEDRLRSLFVSDDKNRSEKELADLFVGLKAVYSKSEQIDKDDKKHEPEQKSVNGWVCTRCTFVNEKSARQCTMCAQHFSSNPNVRLLALTGPSLIFRCLLFQVWICTSCTLENPNSAVRCRVCDQANQSVPYQPVLVRTPSNEGWCFFMLIWNLFLIRSLLFSSSLLFPSPLALSCRSDYKMEPLEKLPVRLASWSNAHVIRARSKSQVEPIVVEKVSFSVLAYCLDRWSISLSFHQEEFISNWKSVTNDVFSFSNSSSSSDDFDWRNVFVAGGSVLACLLPGLGRRGIPPGFCDTDIDIFIYGLSPEESTKKLQYILAYVAKRTPFCASDVLVRALSL